MFYMHLLYLSFFFFNDTATTEIYTLSLHDALPISHVVGVVQERRLYPRAALRLPLRLKRVAGQREPVPVTLVTKNISSSRSEEHTSELQSRLHLVCRLLLEKKKNRLQKLMAAAHSC